MCTKNTAMIFRNFFKFFSTSHDGIICQEDEKPFVVTFSGGMGAQIISAAIYFMLEKEKATVFADLSYFDIKENVAQEGVKGQVSQWGWQLGIFGLSISSFKTNKNLDNRNSNYIIDGIEKTALGMRAFNISEIHSRFELLGDIASDIDLSVKYLCIHIRRGDYLNVASHIISGDDFVKVAKRLSGLVERVVVISDSIIDAKIRNEISQYFEHSDFFDDISANRAHVLMRKAAIIVCSNSQFSLVAAILNTSALVLIPSRWFGGNDRILEGPLLERCKFQLLDPV